MKFHSSGKYFCGIKGKNLISRNILKTSGIQNVFAIYIVLISKKFLKSIKGIFSSGPLYINGSRTFYSRLFSVLFGEEKEVVCAIIETRGTLGNSSPPTYVLPERHNIYIFG